MEDCNIKNCKIVTDSARVIFYCEKSKRMEEERDFFYDVTEAMRSEYMELLVEKYQMVTRCKAFAKKLRQQRTRNRKNYAYLLNKYKSVSKRAKTLEEWKTKGYKRLKKKLKNPNELA